MADKHDEYSQDELLIFVASGHIDCEEELAEIAVGHSRLQLRLSKIVRRDPFVDASKNIGPVHLLRTLVCHCGTLAYPLQNGEIHLLVVAGPVKRTSRERGTLGTLLNLLVEAPILHPHVVLVKRLLD